MVLFWTAKVNLFYKQSHAYGAIFMKRSVFMTVDTYKLMVIVEYASGMGDIMLVEFFSDYDGWSIKESGWILRMIY